MRPIWNRQDMAGRANPSEPRNGESLTAFVNRNRPPQAPAVKGEPKWANDAETLQWQVNGWEVELYIHTADGKIEGFGVSWQREGAIYTLAPNGERELEGWWDGPSEAAEAKERSLKAAAKRP